MKYIKMNVGAKINTSRDKRLSLSFLQCNLLCRGAPGYTLLIAKKLALTSTSSSVQALKAGANAYLYPPLASICADMVSLNTTNTVICVQTIANKVSNNGAEQVCRTSLSQGSSHAIQCLRNVVLDYVPAPQPTMIMIEARQLRELKRTIMRAKSFVNRGNLDDASYRIEDMLNSQHQ